MSDSVIDKARKRMGARRSQRVGSDAELVVRSRLITKGLTLVERIHVGWRKVGHGPTARYVRCAPVSGDWRAVARGGLSVLVECKYRSDADRLIFSDLEPHQVAALSMHHEAGGISLLAWIHPLGVHVMRWCPPGFARGSSIDHGTAAAHEWMP